MNIGVLTSSRADFGIYMPLLKVLHYNPKVNLNIIAFGTHLSKKHGFTIKEIKATNLGKLIQIKTPVNNQSPEQISRNISKTILIFSKFWAECKFDYVVCLGDRYEMFAAITAASTYNIPIAHIHAGETTLGAFDNAFRHSISLFSKILFVTTKQYEQRAKEINPIAKVFNVGALSIDNFKQNNLLNIHQFKSKFGIDLSKSTILCTLHPETVAYNKNIFYTKIYIDTLLEISKSYQILLTMPNADTIGDYMREQFLLKLKNVCNIIIVENLGMLGYLSCIKHCKCLLGNTSSGFVEAAYYNKWVINLGERQSGRIITPNIINVSFDKSKILKIFKSIVIKTLPKKCNIYGSGNAGEKIEQKLIQQILIGK